MKKVTRATEHALDALATLDDGAYYVVVVDEEMVGLPFVAPSRGAAFFLDGKWMVFSPVENAN